MNRLLKDIPVGSSVGIGLGRRGSGKTAKAYSLATALHNRRNTPVYCFKPKNVFLPSYFKNMRRLDSKNSNKALWLPSHNSILLLDDAHLKAHAREWFDDFNIMLDKLQTLARHRNIDIYYTTQQTSRIDKNIIAGVDYLVFSEPSILAPEFERKEIRSLTEEAAEKFKGLTQKEAWQTAFIVTHRRKFVLKDVKLPYYWSEGLSKTYGEVEKKPALKIKLH